MKEVAKDLVTAKNEVGAVLAAVTVMVCDHLITL